MNPKPQAGHVKGKGETTHYRVFKGASENYPSPIYIGNKSYTYHNEWLRRDGGGGWWEKGRGWGVTRTLKEPQSAPSLPPFPLRPSSHMPARVHLLRDSAGPARVAHLCIYTGGKKRGQ